LILESALLIPDTASYCQKTHINLIQPLGKSDRLLGVNASFTFTAHAVYLPRPRIEIPGPQGIQAIFNWQAAKAVSPARMCTAVLVNTVVSY
jgi:hypothetical protein